MDTYIIDGDHKLDEGDRTEVIYGEDERRQNAAFVLSTNKGAFKYNRKLGADHREMLLSEGDRERLLVLCRESLADRADITIADAEIDRTSFHPKLIFSLESSPDKTEEVTVYENV